MSVITTQQIAEPFFNHHFPNVKFRVRNVNGGVENKPTDQIIVLSDSLPDIQSQAVTKPEDLIGRVAFNDVTSAIFRATRGVSTYIVNKLEWMDMFEMNWDRIPNLEQTLNEIKNPPKAAKPQPKATTETPAAAAEPATTTAEPPTPAPAPAEPAAKTATTTEPAAATEPASTTTTTPAATAEPAATTAKPPKPAVATAPKKPIPPPAEITISVEDRQKIAAAIKTIFDANTLSFISVNNPPIQENGKILISLNSLKGNLGEDEEIRMTVISRKIEEVSNDLIVIFPYVNKDVLDKRAKDAPLKAEQQSPRTLPQGLLAH